MTLKVHIFKKTIDIDEKIQKIINFIAIFKKITEIFDLESKKILR